MKKILLLATCVVLAACSQTHTPPAATTADTAAPADSPAPAAAAAPALKLYAMNCGELEFADVDMFADDGSMKGVARTLADPCYLIRHPGGDLLWDSGVRAGKISMNRFVEITSTAPAKIFGLYPRKGTIGIGADADLLVWDGEKRHMLNHETLHMRVDYSPYEGREVVGAPTHVLSRGKVIVENGRYKGKKGDGRFHKRSTFNLM